MPLRERNFNDGIFTLCLSFLNVKTGAVGGGDDDGGEDNKEKAEEEERERLEAIREAEERRKEKHRKMEEEREKMRQEIRDKVNLRQLQPVGFALDFSRSRSFNNVAL